MRLKKGWDGHWFLVFKNEDHLHEWFWLFGFILRRPICCFDGYLNAFKLF